MRRVSWNFHYHVDYICNRCHASHEACELKLENICYTFATGVRHASHEACELKFYIFVMVIKMIKSRLAWGVWVEISARFNYIISVKVSRLAWGVWVEILIMWFVQTIIFVTPRMRRVSWNQFSLFFVILLIVTPRMRRVSWNYCVSNQLLNKSVTPRMRRVSWNYIFSGGSPCRPSHASHEACELKLYIFGR